MFLTRYSCMEEFNIILLLRMLCRKFFPFSKKSDITPILNFMNQEGDSSNNLQIGSAGAGNTFNIKQNNNSLWNDGFLLAEDTSSHQKPITDEAVTRRALFTFFSAILPLVALFADVSGIFGAFNLDYTWIFPAYGSLVGILIVSNLDHIRIFWQRPNIKRKDTYIGSGKIARWNSNNTFTLYKCKTKCKYPNCDEGFIEIVDPPSKDKRKRFLAGICTKCGTSHSYKIDPNWVAYRCELDWSDEERTRLN